MEHTSRDTCFFFTAVIGVLNHGQHVVNDCMLEVSVLEDDSYLKNLKPFAIRVEGFSPHTSLDTIAMFFESHKRSGGGDCKVDFDEKTRTAIIVFENDDGKLLLSLK